MRILLIDEDAILIDLLQRTLGEKNYAIDAVTDGEQGWIYASTYTYDLIILDWHLPKVDGISLCKQFRDYGYHMPILLLTVRNSIQEKVMGLDAGADDYLCKPFNIEELAARIRALLRRSNSNSLPVLTWGDLRLDTCSCQVTYKGNSILLTAKEYQLLELFMRHRQEVFSIEEIIESLWSSMEYPSEATIRSQMRHLRRKLKLAGLPDDPIETLRGRGYCLKSLPQHKNFQEDIFPFSAKDNLYLAEVFDQQERHLATLTTAYEKYQKKSHQHLTVLQEALESWKAGNFTARQREEARLTAHTLAETVDIFGFEQASQLANQLEILLQKNVQQEPEEVLQFQTILNTLRLKLTTEENLSQQISCELIDNPSLLLIIDDDEKFTELLSQRAMYEGMQTLLMASPELAINWLEGLQDNQFPNVVILRLSLIKAASNLISLEDYLSLIAKFNSLIPSIPVIIIADRDRFEDRLLLTQHGASFYLKQPVTPEKVITFCQQALKTSTQGKKIMIVDDDVEFLKPLPSLLKPWKFILTTLHDSRQFWDVLQAVNPDLLILNIEMPYLNSIQICKVLQSHPSWYKLPVMYISIHPEVDIGTQVLNSGADDFMQKPFSAKKLAERIIYHLKSSSKSNAEFNR